MKIFIKRFAFIFTFLFLFTLSLAPAVFGQSGSEVLIAGNPPLTQADVRSVAKYYERGLNIEFSSEQLNELQQILERNWRKFQKSNPQSLSKWLVTISKINGISGEKRERIKDEISDAVLADLRGSSQAELSRFVLDVYENRENQNENIAENETGASDANEQRRSESERKSNETITPYTDEYAPVQGTIKLSDIAGKWTKGTVSTSGCRNAVTGDYKSGYGFTNQHEISPSGSFDYYNFATVSLYDCTTELFTKMKGRAQISGSRVTFSYTSGTVDVKDSCKKTIVTKPAQINSATFQLERGKKFLRMCEFGKESYCLYKAEE